MDQASIEDNELESLKQGVIKLINERLARRDALRKQISEAQQQIAADQKELKDVDTFLRQVANIIKNAASPNVDQSLPVNVHPIRSGERPAVKDRGRFTGLVVRDALVKIAWENGGILDSGEACKTLIEAGVFRDMRHAGANVYPVLSRRPDLFRRIEKGVYELVKAPSETDPNLSDSSEDSDEDSVEDGEEGDDYAALDEEGFPSATFTAMGKPGDYPRLQFRQSRLPAFNPRTDPDPDEAIALGRSA